MDKKSKMDAEEHEFQWIHKFGPCEPALKILNQTEQKNQKSKMAAEGHEFQGNFEMGTHEPVYKKWGRSR